MSTHTLEKMTRDRFRVMSLAPRRKCPRNVVQMKEAMAAFLAVTALQFLATVRDQKLFWSKFDVSVFSRECSVLNRVEGGEETRSGTEKRCSHNLQSGHPAWWSADNYSIFPTVNILEARIEANRQKKSKMLKKNDIMQLCFSCISYLSFGTEMRGKLTQPC